MDTQPLIHVRGQLYLPCISTQTVDQKNVRTTFGKVPLPNRFDQPMTQWVVISREPISLLEPAEPQKQPSETSNISSTTNVTSSAEIADSAPADAPHQTAAQIMSDVVLNQVAALMRGTKTPEDASRAINEAKADLGIERETPDVADAMHRNGIYMPQQTADETPLMSDRAVLALARMMAVDAELRGLDTPAEVERKMAVIEEAIYGRDDSPTNDRSYEEPLFVQEALQRNDVLIFKDFGAERDLDDEPTGYMRPCETCRGRGLVGGGEYAIPCHDCQGTGIHDDDEPVTSIMAQEIDLPGEPVPAQVAISDLKDAAGYVPIVDLPVTLPTSFTYRVENGVAIMTKRDELADLAKITAERDAAYAVIDAIRSHLNDAAIEHSGYGQRTMGQADRVKMLMERERRNQEQMIKAIQARRVAEAERDDAKKALASAINAGRQHKADLRAAKARYAFLWQAYERLTRQFVKLASAASDVYDLEFEEDYSDNLRRLRRIMKVLGVRFTRKD